MSYNKTTWITGDIITAEKLNNIENEVAKIDGISTDLDNLSTELTNEISSLSEDLSGDIDTLSEKVTQVERAVGAPMVASLVSQMTDQTRVYVYTGSETGYTAGNWYYYDGTAWVSGGVYNSVAVETDKTLSVEDEAADAKAVGDEIKNVAAVSNTQPSSEFNKIWVKETPQTEVQVPTISEFNTVVGDVSELKSDTSDILRLDDLELPFEIANPGYYVAYANGNLVTTASGNATDFIDVSDYTFIKYKRNNSTSYNPTSGMAFYDANKTYITGCSATPSQETMIAYTDVVAPVPSGAVYARFTTFADTETAGEFAISGIGRVQDLGKVLSKNLMGNDSLFYEVYIPAHAQVTFSHFDGSEFTNDNPTVYFYDENYSYFDWFSLRIQDTSRTISVNKDTRYLRFSKKPPIPFMVNYGPTPLPYEEYFDAGLKAKESIDRVNNNINLVDAKLCKDMGYVDFMPDYDFADKYQNVRAIGNKYGFKVIGSNGGAGVGLRLNTIYTLDRANYHASTDRFLGIQLEAGTKYRLKSQIISGHSAMDSSGDYFCMSVSVYKSGNSNTIVSLVNRTETEWEGEFIAPDEPVTMLLYVPPNTTHDCEMYVTLEKDVETEIKSYYLSEMQDTIQKVRDASVSPSLTFLDVTDIHRYSANASGVQNFDDMIENMKYFCNNVKCDCIINHGDMTDGNVVQGTTLQRGYDCTKDFLSIGIPYLFANGNHDTNYYTSGEPYLFTRDENYKAYFTATKGVTYNVNENGTDYYLDFVGIDVRVIVLNANNVASSHYAYGTSTAAWLAEALNTTKPVIVAVHQSPIKEQVYAKLNTTRGAAIASALQNFVNNGGTLIMLSGHSHVDIAFVTPWLSIMQTCQRYTSGEGTIITPTDENPTEITGFIDNIVKPERIANTYTEDAWSVGIFKPGEMELDLIRFGAGSDRYFHVAPISPTTLTTKLTGTITWSSSDTTVATVSDGVVTGVANGRCAILAKDESGNYECWIVEVV